MALTFLFALHGALAQQLAATAPETRTATVYAPATYLGRSMSKEAPPDAIPPRDPHWLAGLWSLRGVTARTAAEIKPAYRSRIPSSAGSTSPAQGANPDASQLCIPTAFFGAGAGYPTLIIQTEKQITVINEENHRTQLIYLDRGFPKTLRPSYAGYSVGHWEGDTLVAETRAIRPPKGTISLPNYRVFERIRKINNGRQLKQEVTFVSSAYERPATMVVLHNWRPDLRIQEEICEEFSDPYNRDYYK